MTEGKKLEYQGIRDEYALLTQTISATVNFSVISCVAIFSFLSSKEDISFMLYGLALLIIIPACLIIISRFQSMLRLASYLHVFIEPGSDIQYETRLLKFKTNNKFKFRKTILWVYFGLIIINIGLFISKGYYCIQHITFYISSLVVFAFIYHFMTIDWKQKFIQSWNEVKRNEVVNNQSI